MLRPKPVSPLLAQLLVLPVWGHAADRMGKKPVMAIAALGLVPVGFAWCFVSPSMAWLGYALSAAGAALWTGVEVANLNFVLEFSGSADGENGGSSYVAMNSVIINIAGCVGGLSAGVIATLLKDWHWHIGLPGLSDVTFYEVLFALSGMMRLLAAVAFLPRLREPDARSTTETFKLITANIYNNLFGAILMPLRLLRVRTAREPIVLPLEPQARPARPLRKAA